MAKGQKHSNREIRKPKQAKSKPTAAPSSFLANAAAGSMGKSSSGKPKGAHN